MPAKVSFRQLSPEVLLVIFLMIIASFLAGLSVGRRMGPIMDIGIIEPGGGVAPGGVDPVPPASNIDGREPAPIDGGVACTMEAKVCPDGSYVGRQGPNCEFSPCPGEVQ